MKIIDCFTFFNELEQLEFRLNYLDPFVDLFVIAEANLTHSGNPKPYHFKENESRFAAWKHKIIYLQVELSTDGLVFNANEEKYNPTNGSWILENQQREALWTIKNQLEQEDWVMVSDLDEIPNMNVVKRKFNGNTTALSQLFHNYFFNCRNIKADRWWNGTVVCTGKYFIENGPQHIRNNRNEYPRIKKAGWHFSYLGGVEAIRKKLMSFSHTEFNKAEYLDEKHILKSLDQGTDVLMRKDVAYRFVSLYAFPKSLRSIMRKYPHFIRNIGFLKQIKELLKK
jgi:beta-1,4-mannosyl-glycoprotein beta-1,4-N-acetylglucosaminyltransferase